MFSLELGFLIEFKEYKKEKRKKKKEIILFNLLCKNKFVGLYKGLQMLEGIMLLYQLVFEKVVLCYYACIR